MERHALMLMSVKIDHVIRMQHVITLKEAFYASVAVDLWVMGCLVYVSEVFICMYLCVHVIFVESALFEQSVLALIYYR